MQRGFLILIFCAFAGLLAAQSVPGTLSYQGILLQNDGITPLPDGPQTIVFNFYDVASGGSPQFSRTTTVNTLKGLYTCILGDGTAGNAPLPASVGSQQMFIGIAVNGGTELAPRAQLTTTPYAWMAQSAYSIADNTIGTAKLVDGAVTNAKLAPGIDAGKVTTGTLAGSLVGAGVAGGNLTDGSVTSAKITDGTITNADVSATAALTDTKFATISTAGKVANSATTATNANAANSIVARDASGNFTAGTITANLVGSVTGSISGNAATVTTNANLTGDVTSVGNTTTIAPGAIVDADINAAASIADTKLAIITTPGKVANSATSATTANTANTIVARDASGNFSAGTVTANLVGNVTGNISGNAATVTTNANLTGDVTSVGNATTIINGVITTAKVADGAITNQKLGTDIDAGKIAGGNLSIGAGTITSGSITSSGIISGNGSGITTLNASEISSGTINAARLPASTLTGTGTNGNVAFWNGTTSFGNSTGLFWQNTAPQSLGIGTTSPTARLHISGDGSLRRGIQLSQTTANTTWAINNFETGASEGAGNFGINQVGVANRLVINTSGNIGLSTPSIPTQRLEVGEGHLKINGTSSGTYSGLILGNSATATDNFHWVNENNGGRKLNLYNGNFGIGTNLVTVTSAGNVGIGVPSPFFPLSVYSVITRAVNVEQDYSGANTQFGMTVDMTSGTGTGSKYGIDCNVTGSVASTAALYGLETDIVPTGSGPAYGLNVSLSNAGTGLRYGGEVSVITNATNTSNAFGISALAAGAGTGNHYGLLGTSQGQGVSYGVVGQALTGTIAYGVHGNAASSATTNYGVFGAASGGTTNYAGFFSGNLRVTGIPTANQTNFTLISDLRVKKDISPFLDGLQEILEIKPVRFKFNGLGESEDDGKEQIGIIAQEIKAILPYTVETQKRKLHPNDESLTDFFVFNGSSLQYVLINAIKEQQSQIEDLKTANKALEARLSALEGLLSKATSGSTSASKTDKP